MTDRTITLPATIVERLEILAEHQGRSVDEVVGDLLNTYAPTPVQANHWALNLAEAMEAAELDWIDDPEASINSRRHFAEHLRQRWERTQALEDDRG